MNIEISPIRKLSDSVFLVSEEDYQKVIQGGAKTGRLMVYDPEHPDLCLIQTSTGTITLTTDPNYKS